MANIGDPIRRFTVVPLTEPVPDRLLAALRKPSAHTAGEMVLAMSSHLKRGTLTNCMQRSAARTGLGHSGARWWPR